MRMNYGFLVMIMASLVSPQAIAYCDSRGNSTNYEWIDSITIGSVSHRSNDNGGYADFSNRIISLEVGDNPVELTPGFASGAYPEQWRVWIDLNADQNYSHDEMVFGAFRSGVASGTITLPELSEDLVTGMRISMQYYREPQPCGSFRYGEVEDFTASIRVGDQIPPTVVSVSPVDNDTDVAVDRLIQVTFSEYMDPDPSPGALRVTLDGGDVAGNLVSSGAQMTFIPDDTLLRGARYDVTVLAGIEDAAGNPMQSDYDWSFQTVPAPPEPLTIVEAFPTDGSIDISQGQAVTVKYSRTLHGASVNDDTFMLADGAGRIQGQTYALGDTAWFVPSSALQRETVYTATITGNVEDSEGNRHGEDLQWSFLTREIEPDYCTIETLDTSTLWITGVRLGIHAFGYGGPPFFNFLDNSDAVFPMDRNTPYLLELDSDGSATAGPVYWTLWVDWNHDGQFASSEQLFHGSGQDIDFASVSVPQGALASWARMRVTVSDQPNSSPCGTLNQGYAIDYRVKVSEDPEQMVVSDIQPADGSFNVPIDSLITVNFSRPVNPVSLINRVALTANGDPIMGQMALANNDQQLIFDPIGELEYNLVYDLTVSSGVEDLQGNGTQIDAVATFMTSDSPSAVFLIAGTVSVAGNPLPGATITLSGNGSQQATSNNAGQYVLGSLEAGDYTVSINKPGYSFTPQSIQVTVADSNLLNIDFSASEATSLLINGDFETDDLSGFELFLTADGEMDTDVVPFDVNGDGTDSSAARFSVGILGDPDGSSHGGGISQQLILSEGDLQVSMNIAASADLSNSDGGLVQLFWNNQLMDSHDFGSMSTGQTDRATLSFGLPGIQEGEHELSILFTRTLEKSNIDLYLDDIILISSGN